MGSENVLLVLEDKEQLIRLNNIVQTDFFKIKLVKLHGHAHLNYLFSTNVKEFFYVLKSLVFTWFLCLRYRIADVTISSIEPEKYLYLLWLPFLSVKYILHTEPEPAMSSFTITTCNLRLSKRKLIVTVSCSMKAVICRHWGINAPCQNLVIVIYNCIGSADSKKTGTAAKPKDKLLVTTLGHVDIRKNPKIWLEVAKKVTAIRSQVEFNWLGDGILLNEFAAATETETSIKFLGKIENCMPHLEKSAIYYQPSKLEPHGIAVLEAMYSHLPCVVSNVGGLPESVRDSYNGFVVDPLNADQHAEALLALIDHPEIREKFAMHSYHRYERYFSYEQFRLKMNAIYSDGPPLKQFTSQDTEPCSLR